jgi:hypothetical protein
MSYLNKIILCFTKNNVVGYQYSDRIISENGDEFETQKDFIDLYLRRCNMNKLNESVNGIRDENADGQ